MSNNTLKNIAKVVGVGALLYAAYKIGQKSGRGEYPFESNQDLNSPTLNEVEVLPCRSEEEEILELIKELKSKPYKTKKDFNNIDLLEIKLQQIRKNKL